MLPPIRGGIYCRAEPSSDAGSSGDESDTDRDADNADEDGSSVSELTSLTPFTSRGSSVEQDCQLDSVASVRRRVPVASGTVAKDDCLLSATVIAGDKAPVQLTPAQYTDFAVQQGIELDLRNYPSLDPVTQNDIASQYRLLHERIKGHGLYNCPYLDYGKEVARYSTLFATFLVALHYEWYLTSAIFLGLFWVCPMPLDLAMHLSVHYLY
jgi:delta8-fatty-acid desaturase